ncbi:MAG: tRNA pseudouridine synthase [Planctomycetota bacterium]
MKLRCTPDDFHVEELTSVSPAGGPFAFYRLTKTSIGTPEAIHALTERWKIARHRISYGGLKDRHAVTIQHLTIHNGPRQSLQQKSIHLEYLGQVSAPFTSAMISANRFGLVLRDMHTDAVQQAQTAVRTVARTGLPNYFDDQRFGSLGNSGQWIAREWCLGNWERALWLALADPHADDSSSERRQKQILRDNWGRWPECQQMLERSHRRSIITYLSDKVKVGRDPDYRGAIARISVDLRGLYLSAWQSALWNRLLNEYLRANCPAEELRSQTLASGDVVFPMAWSGLAEPAAIELPLPSARIDRPEGEIGDLLDRVLTAENIELRQIRVKYPRDSFFSKGSRRAVIHPSNLDCSAETDELYPGRKKLRLNFELPRGSYATILVKRLTIDNAACG